jgi:hypothetical protein
LFQNHLRYPYDKRITNTGDYSLKNITPLVDPKIYVLDENLSGYYGTKPSHLYAEACEIVRIGSSDDLLLEAAEKRNLTIITHDKGFVIKSLKKNKDIIYEDHFGDRYFMSGKNTKLVDKNERRKIIRTPSSRQNSLRLLYAATPFSYTMSGIHLGYFL